MAKFVPNFFPFGEAGDEVSFYFCSRNVCFFDGLFFLRSAVSVVHRVAHSTMSKCFYPMYKQST